MIAHLLLRASWWKTEVLVAVARACNVFFLQCSATRQVKPLAEKEKHRCEIGKCKVRPVDVAQKTTRQSLAAW